MIFDVICRIHMKPGARQRPLLAKVPLNVRERKAERKTER